MEIFPFSSSLPPSEFQTGSKSNSIMVFQNTLYSLINSALNKSTTTLCLIFMPQHLQITSELWEMNSYTKLHTRIWLVFTLVEGRYTIIQFNTTHLAQTECHANPICHTHRSHHSLKTCWHFLTCNQKIMKPLT